MSFMPWSEALEAGIGIIDEQHRWLVDQTNALHGAVAASTSSEQIGQILNDLMDYTMNHFIVEEELFTRLGYPEGDAHRAQHNYFCDKIMSLITRHEAATKWT